MRIEDCWQGPAALLLSLSFLQVLTNSLSDSSIQLMPWKGEDV